MFLRSLVAVILLASSGAFHFQIRGSRAQAGKGVLSPTEMAKRDSGSGGAVPSPQPDNIQSWGKYSTSCLSACDYALFAPIHDIDTDSNSFPLSF